MTRYFPGMTGFGTGDITSTATHHSPNTATYRRKPHSRGQCL